MASRPRSRCVARTRTRTRTLTRTRTRTRTLTLILTLTLPAVKALCAAAAHTSPYLPIPPHISHISPHLQALCAAAEAAVRDGKAEILVLSDREAHPDGLGGEAATQAAAAGRTAEMTFIPPMVAVGAVHHHLIQVGLRMDTSIIAETAQAWSTHHMNCLIGYGAHAVHPYLLWRAVRHHYAPNPSPNPALTQP